MAASTAAATSRDNDERVVLKAIEQRQSIAKNYTPIVNPTTQTAMLTLRKHGECTIVDPRACFNHYDAGADLACAMYVHISLPYWHAMIHAGLVQNRIRCVLRCTENDSYVFVVARNNPRAGARASDNVEDLLNKLRARQGSCRPGVELLGLDYSFVQPKSLSRKRRHNGDQSAPPPVTTAVISARRWMRRMRKAKHLYDCQRRLHTEEEARRAGAVACAPARRAGDQSGGGRVHVPILVIEAPWGLAPDRSGR